MIDTDLITEYLEGPAILRQAVDGMADEQLDAKPIPGQWSTRQVICHIADFELVYADRMKRVIAEDHPTLFGGDPDTFASTLAYEQRHLEDELRLIESIRCHMARILKTISDETFERLGHHSEDGPIQLASLLIGITRHLPHHVRFIEAKRRALT